MIEDSWAERLMAASKEDLAYVRESFQKRASQEPRAQAVMDQLMVFEGTPFDAEHPEPYFAEKRLLDEMIASELDSDSIWDFIELASKLMESSRASVNAGKRHAENRAMKAQVFLWLDANMARFKSMDAAAEAIAETQVPLTFRAVREWVGQWKKLRSASTP